MRRFGKHLCPRKTAPLWGAVWWAEVETSQVRKVATPQTFYSILPSRCGLLVRTTETAVRRTPLPTQNGTPFGAPSGGQRWRPHRFGRSQRRKLFTLFCRTAAACSYEPPKRRFGEHLCPRKTAPLWGCRLVGRGGFEPPKSVTSDLQSDPFGRSGICPHGASRWNRTADRGIFSPLLYQLSYRGISVFGNIFLRTKIMATQTRLELVTSSVTGWRSNQLSYWAV